MLFFKNIRQTDPKSSSCYQNTEWNAENIPHFMANLHLHILIEPLVLSVELRSLCWVLDENELCWVFSYA